MNGEQDNQVATSSRLYRLLDQHFDREQLKLLAYDLGYDYDNLSGERKLNKAQDLVAQMERKGQLEHLIRTARHYRPSVAWPGSRPPSATPTAEPSLPPGPPFANPFGRTGRVEDPAYYLVRRPLTDEIMGELVKGVSLSIVGESQTGKSSLLWHIKTAGPAALNRPPADFVYISLELVHSEDDFFEHICYELGVPTGRGYRLARSLKGRQVVFCLDEVEKMTWYGFSLEVRSELRGLADGSNAPLTLVIASRSPLGRLFPDSPELTSPLAGLCSQIQLANFTLAEAKALVEWQLRGSGLVFPPAEVEQAWQRSGGHPARLQQALKESFNAWLRRGLGD
ncbi:MAG: ATP-binding protein [Chloroflexi bacterium]|nr:ATP-binding protein [Chloroflexota bacterium]MCI0579473.1 ATP-binding protein [Chloroflexota bacterium]MCI0646256.1 ATP-binding protein [Chloroflexota bacterium]MCI0732124.1 ATP-binding protein [Chloroflexota bacterium]